MKGPTGSTSLLYFEDEVPEYLKIKFEQVVTSNDSLLENHQYDALSLSQLAVQSHNVDIQKAQEPWKTVRLFLSSTFGIFYFLFFYFLFFILLLLF